MFAAPNPSGTISSTVSNTYWMSLLLRKVHRERNSQIRCVVQISRTVSLRRFAGDRTQVRPARADRSPAIERRGFPQSPLCCRADEIVLVVRGGSRERLSSPVVVEPAEQFGCPFPDAFVGIGQPIDELADPQRDSSAGSARSAGSSSHRYSGSSSISRESPATRTGSSCFCFLVLQVSSCRYTCRPSSTVADRISCSRRASHSS